MDNNDDHKSNIETNIITNFDNNLLEIIDEDNYNDDDENNIKDIILFNLDENSILKENKIKHNTVLNATTGIDIIDDMKVPYNSPREDINKSQNNIINEIKEEIKNNINKGHMNNKYSLINVKKEYENINKLNNVEINTAKHIINDSFKKYREIKDNQLDGIKNTNKLNSDNTLNICDDSVNNINNNWDDSANNTLNNWYNIFKQQSFIYQKILDNNIYTSQILLIIIIIFSSTLGIFTGFKLWINNELFQLISNILLMFSNLIISILTIISKRYNDDTINERFRSHIEEIDNFKGEISAQLLKDPKYRMNAIEFFAYYNDRYTKLINKSPSLKVNEIKEAKELYIELIGNLHHNNV